MANPNQLSDTLSKLNLNRQTTNKFIDYETKNKQTQTVISNVPDLRCKLQKGPQDLSNAINGVLKRFCEEKKIPFMFDPRYPTEEDIENKAKIEAFLNNPLFLENFSLYLEDKKREAIKLGIIKE